MQLGFLIDHDKCIGCHACTVACKAENAVPVGSFRTWVKYTEVGRFPDVRRHFAVLRCNHCTDAPCVTICPVNALEKRPDGIVDIDRDACIGCRACMQACPYDAIYLNDDLGKVEKCHFCAHRVEVGLEPACAVVCPEQAIVAGDVHDPESPISNLISQNTVQVRRPGQGTGPNVYYKGADAVSLEPGSARRPDTYIWSDRPPHKPEAWPDGLGVTPDATTVLDAGHRVEWGWPVAAYLVTKGIAAGTALLAPFASAAGLSGFAAGYVPELLALVFACLTCLLLVEDLAHPRLFYRLLTRPNWSSWLVRGGVVLAAFMTVTAACLALRWMGLDAAADALRWVDALLGLAVAGYTALLFRQCKGRDLWESSHVLLPHLLVQALLCGGAALLPLAPQSILLKITFAAGAVLHLGFAIAERFRPHPTDNARQAAAFLPVVHLGPLRPWRDGLIAVAVSLIVLLVLPAAAFVPALVGLYLYEHAFVRAGQLPPLS